MMRMKVLEHLICLVNPATVPSRDTTTLDGSKVWKFASDPLISNYNDSQVEVCQSDQTMGSLVDRVNLPP